MSLRLVICLIEIPELVGIHTKSCYVVVWFPYMYSVLYKKLWLTTEIQKFVSACIWTSDILFILYVQNSYVQYKNSLQTI